MLTVHHLNNSRSQRVLWLLEELQLPYEIQKYERDRKTLAALPRASGDLSPLRSADSLDPAVIFTAEDSPRWRSAQEELKAAGVGDVMGGVNPGDQRAIYQLVRYLKPRAVLESSSAVTAGRSMMRRSGSRRQPRSVLGSTRSGLAERHFRLASCSWHPASRSGSTRVGSIGTRSSAGSPGPARPTHSGSSSNDSSSTPSSK